MAIVFNCPQCEHPYRLPDKLAGKRATCKNPDCRQMIVIPAATSGLSIAELGGIVPESNGKDQTPLPTNPADIEAAALAALSDSEQERDDAAAGNAIPVVCPHCDHKWTEPIAKAGKNTLCPNPECRQRVKVPEPKKGDAPHDWRTGASSKPTLAKENFEKPADVMDAEARVVGKDAWTKGGGAEQDLEPISLKRRLFVAALIGAPVLAIAAGIWLLVAWRGRDREEQEIKPAIDEFAQFGTGELAPAQAPIFAAILELAAGEHALRTEKVKPDKALELAFQHFTTARDKLRQASGPERNAVVGELALATLGLGGTDEQIKVDARYRWLPGGTKRFNEKTHTVHQELRQTLQLLLGAADFDFRATLLRRLTREVVKKEQLELAVDLPVMLFSEPELTEAKAIAALEIWRINRGSEKAGQIADELKTKTAGANPHPSSAHTLWLLVGTEKPPSIVQPPSATALSDTSRFAYTGLAILQDNPSEGLELARRSGGTLAGQLKALALYAEWAPDPGPAFDFALSALNAQKGKKDAVPPPQSVVLRLAQLAASTGKTEPAKHLADAFTGEGLKAWAKGDAIRFAATPENKTLFDDAALDVPSDPKKQHAGDAWGRLWIARHNARVTGDKGKVMKEIATWTKGTMHPFGLAGIALGLHDRP